jgi:CO/xanthine dehydrogenase Mo-binding subunit
MPDGGVKAFFGKMDMGQGLDVAVAQVVAEELDVGFNRVEVLMGDTATSCNQGGASGSTGVSSGVRLLRKAAAEARRVLVSSASEKLGIPVSGLKTEDGVVSGGGKQATYAELVGGKHFHHAVKWNGQTGNPMDIEVPAKPKPAATWRGRCTAPATS